MCVNVSHTQTISVPKNVNNVARVTHIVTIIRKKKLFKLDVRSVLTQTNLYGCYAYHVGCGTMTRIQQIKQIRFYEINAKKKKNAPE